MIKANDTVLNIIQEEYRLPLLETSDTATFNNNKSGIILNSLKPQLRKCW